MKSKKQKFKITKPMRVFIIDSCTLLKRELVGGNPKSYYGRVIITN